MARSRYFLLAFDQGTTSSRSILFDLEGRPVAVAKQQFTQIYPQPGWVEHDPVEIYASQLATAHAVLQQAGVGAEAVAALGITNQRETLVVWERKTGRPVYNAIVWQDRRTADWCEELRGQAGVVDRVRQVTGLVIDPYFSGSKAKWLVDHIPGLREKAAAGDLCFGTVDSWLIFNLTGGRVHATDVSNASRTMLFNLRTLDWDEEMLELLDLPTAWLPRVQPSASHFGATDPAIFGRPIPITGVAGDQQAALFGQGCVQPGMAKNTYGTGCFLLMNTGERPVSSKSGLLTTVAWQLAAQPAVYALEGSVFIAGAAVQWLRDGLGIISSSAESETLAGSVADTGRVYFVPALSGLGTPYWDPYARGTIVGITRGTTRAHLVRATLEAIAYQTRDVLAAMQEDSGLTLRELRVDGGAAANNFLMQFQADLLGVRVMRPQVTETTALGAALLAGVGAGLLPAPEQAHGAGATEAVGAGCEGDKPRAGGFRVDRVFEPRLDEEERERLYRGWRRAVARARGWARDDGQEC
ncbi:MAG: glycerol kinase GlpK [Limnochordales bacterium]|nr:glycerol kinase GlpK [Limnochordales bacterium]